LSCHEGAFGYCHFRSSREIQLQIEYDPAPPFNSGSPRTASSETAEAVRRRFAPLNEQRRDVAHRVGQKLGVLQSK
jgi:cyclohexyl-isocyanide hydratase